MILPNCQRIERSIERRPEIVDAVTCDQRPSIQRRLGLDLDDKSVAGAISVAIAGDDIRIVTVPFGQFGFKRFQMLMSSSEF